MHNMKACERDSFFQLKVYERGIFSIKMVQNGKGLGLGAEPIRGRFNLSDRASFRSH